MRGGARAALAWAAAGALAAAAWARADPFVDPLDLPAAPSALAARAPITAVARAGERLVAVGQRGHVLGSDDGGATWTQAASPVSTDLTAVHFPTAARGFAVGHDGVVLSTEDAGRTWTRRLDGRAIGALLRDRYGARAGGDPVGEQAALLAERAPGLALLAVRFETERAGFVAGAFGLLLRTEDGGATWTPWLERAENPGALHLLAIAGAGDALLLAGERGLLLRLAPGEGSFRRIAGGRRATLFGLAAAGDAVVAFGLGGVVLLGGDGGRSWGEVASGAEDSLVGAVWLPGAGLVLVSQAGQRFVSVDGGRTLRPGPPGPRLPTSAVVAADGATLVLAGAGGLRRERLDAKGGASWPATTAATPAR